MLVSSFPNRKLNLRFGFFYANLQQPLSQPSADSIPTPFVPSGHFPLIGGIGPWKGSQGVRTAGSAAEVGDDLSVSLWLTAPLKGEPWVRHIPAAFPYEGKVARRSRDG